MKLLLSTATLLVLVVLVTPSLRAQSYGPYYDPYWDIQYQQYLQWQQYLQYLQQNDPYYELWCTTNYICSPISRIKYTNPAAIHSVYLHGQRHRGGDCHTPLFPGQIGLEEGKST